MRFKLLIIGVAGFLIYSGVQEMKLSSVAKAEPQKVTAEELEDNGPGDNAHVQVSDFLALTWSYVYEYDEDYPEVYKTVWVPLAPMGGSFHEELAESVDAEGNFTGDPPMPDQVKIILKSFSIDNVEELVTVADKEVISGMVINEIESLGGQEKRLLKESYPGINFNNVYILEHARTPSSAGNLLGYFGGGGVLGLFGLFLLFVPGSKDEEAVHT